MQKAIIPRSSRIESSTSSKTRSKQTLRLWLRLFSCQSMIEDRIRTLLRNQHGITLPQFDVLAELENVDRSLTMTELSKLLVVSNGNITGVIDRLERDQFLTRIRSEKDRRVQHIRLTSQGKARFLKIAAEHEQWVAQLLSDINPKEVDQMIELLKNTKESILNSSI